MAVSIYYDGDCPFCARYVQFIKLQETVGEVRLVDLRRDNSLRLELKKQGFNLDEGMVVDQDGQRLGGADAVNMLALLSTPSGLGESEKCVTPYSSFQVCTVIAVAPLANTRLTQIVRI